MNRYWILLYDPTRDRQMRVFRDARTLEEARDAAVLDTGLHLIAAGLQRRECIDVRPAGPRP